MDDNYSIFANTVLCFVLFLLYLQYLVDSHDIWGWAPEAGISGMDK